MDEAIADSGIDAVIDRVARKAGISEQAATTAVDEVLTAVKQKLPPTIAHKLVEVVAGEAEFQSHELPPIAQRRRVAVSRLQHRDIASKTTGLLKAVPQLGRKCWRCLLGLFR